MIQGLLMVITPWLFYGYIGYQNNYEYLQVAYEVGFIKKLPSKIMFILFGFLFMGRLNNEIFDNVAKICPSDEYNQLLIKYKKRLKYKYIIMLDIILPAIVCLCLVGGVNIPEYIVNFVILFCPFTGILLLPLYGFPFQKIRKYVEQVLLEKYRMMMYERNLYYQHAVKEN